MPKQYNIHIDTLKDYLAGRLDGKAMHAVEKAALEDPFLAEALEGLVEAPDQSMAGLESLKASLKERMKPAGQNGQLSIGRGIRYWWYGVAALFVVGLGIYLLMQYQSDMTGTGNLTQDIVRGVDQAPGQNQEVLPGADEDNTETSQGLAIGDSLSGVLSLDSASKTAENKSKIARAKDGSDEANPQQLESKGYADNEMQPAEAAGIKASKLIPDSNALALNIDDEPNPASPLDQIAYNRQLSMRKKSVNPEAISQQSGEERLTMQNTRSRLNQDTAYRSTKDKMEGKMAGLQKGESPKRLAKSNQPLSDVVIAGNATEQAMIADNDSVDMEELSKDPDLVMQKSRLRPTIEMKAYETYINAEIEKLRSSHELDGSVKAIVLLKFLIPENGDGKPSHISVEFSDSRTLSRWAKKILSEGPAWEVIPGTQAPYWGWYAVVFK